VLPLFARRPIVVLSSADQAEGKTMQTPKRLRREMRQLAAKAEEFELRAALQPLANDFKRWEAGAIDSFDLKALIHDFHQGQAREIYVRYDTADPAPLVARAVVLGILDPATISAEVLADLERLIELIKANAEQEIEPVAGPQPSGSRTD
jgi:hypothetical protein